MGRGFTKSIGLTSSFVAELWGLRDELMICCNLNISSLAVELDAKVIVDILNKPASAFLRFVLSIAFVKRIDVRIALLE